jgi:NADPH-dependent ferric siderophore reductase
VVQGSASSPGSEPRPVSPETAATAERLGAPALALRIVDVVDEAPALRRITVEDARLGDATWHPGQDLTLAIPGGGARSLKRRYTIRRLDHAAGTADLQVLLHGDGPGARWAAAVQPGDEVEAMGPRGKIWVRPDAAWHLFVGDEAYLPATFAMVESLPAGGEATVVLEVGADVGQQSHDAAASVRGPVWVARNPVGAGEPGVQLLDALESLGLPDGGAGGAAYVGGEAKAVAAIRGWLIGHGWPAEAIAAKAYWRADKSNQDHGEPEKD